MIIKSNKSNKEIEFIKLKDGQLFSLEDLNNDTKSYYIKIDSSTIPNKPEPYDTIARYGYAVDLENGRFVSMRNETMIVLENGCLMVED